MITITYSGLLHRIQVRSYNAYKYPKTPQNLPEIQTTLRNLFLDTPLLKILS